jgi:integrase
LQALEALKDFAAGTWHKAISHLPGIIEFAVSVVPNDDGIKRVIRNVATYDEFLPSVDPIFNPCSAPFARLVKRIFPLRDYTLKSQFFGRAHELIALKGIDLDFNGRFIDVQRNLSRGKIKSPKNGKTRRVDMSKNLAAVLNDLLSKKRAAAVRRELEKPAGERRDAAAVINAVMEDWLFTTPEIVAKSEGAKRRRSPETKTRGGTQLDPSNLRKVFNKLLTAAKLRRVRFHDLRHTFASLLFQQGESPVYVKEQMGHSSIQVTVDIYGHLIPGGNRQAVDKLDTPVPTETDKEASTA